MPLPDDMKKKVSVTEQNGVAVAIGDSTSDEWIKSDMYADPTDVC